MKTRLQVFGMVIAAAGMMFLSACGGDNDNNNGGNTPVPTNTPVNTATTKATATTAPVNTNTPTATTAVVNTSTPTETSTVGGPTNTPANTPTPTSTTTGVTCGNNVIEAPEQCDDGNTFGGDGCASNCTTETAQVCTFSSASVSNVQTAIFAIPLALTGQQTLTTGGIRSDDPLKIIPVVIKSTDVKFDPVQVPGLVCACVRGADKAEYGPGNSALGATSCSASGLQNINYVTTIDHNTGDATCADGTKEDGSAAHPHSGVCNSNPTTVNSGGDGGVGATQITSNSAISLISDGGACEVDGAGDPGLYGPDGSACTPDDPGQAAPTITVTTSGSAGGQVLHANNTASSKIAEGETCGAGACIATATGVVPNCTTLSIAGSATASAFIQIDAAQIGDDIVTSTFACQ